MLRNEQIEGVQGMRSPDVFIPNSFDLQWMLACTSGKHFLEEHVGIGKDVETPIDFEQLLPLWEEFMQFGRNTIQNVANNLRIPLPDYIRVDMQEAINDNVGSETLAGVRKNEDGTITLKIYIHSLMPYFLAYTDTHRFRKQLALYQFGSTIAHELRHIYHYEYVPKTLERQKRNNSYFKRRYEYDARLFALRWLNTQKPKDFGGRIGLGLAKMMGRLEIAAFKKEKEQELKGNL